MPFYEYECSACKFYVEALQKISEPPLRKCPSCKKQSLKRLVSAPVFRLKGGGWYETDFKSDKEEKRNLAGREEGAETKSEESKTEPAKETAVAEAKPAVESKKPEAPKERSGKVVSVSRPAARPAHKPAGKPAGRPAAAAKAKKPVRPAAKKKVGRA